MFIIAADFNTLLDVKKTNKAVDKAHIKMQKKLNDLIEHS